MDAAPLPLPPSLALTHLRPLSGWWAGGLAEWDGSPRFPHAAQNNVQFKT